MRGHLSLPKSLGVVRHLFQLTNNFAIKMAKKHLSLTCARWEVLLHCLAYPMAQQCLTAAPPGMKPLTASPHSMTAPRGMAAPYNMAATHGSPHRMAAPHRSPSRHGSPSGHGNPPRDQLMMLQFLTGWQPLTAAPHNMAAPHRITS